MEEQFQDLWQARHDGSQVKAGRVLIADPFLEGRYFNRSVIYMIEHNEQGSVGFVLNKPLSTGADKLLDALPGTRFSLYAGGPVETGMLCYLHRFSWLEGARALPDGVYQGGDFSALMKTIHAGETSPGDIRFFMGYSGWSPGQLDKELKERSWVVGDITPGQLFSPSGDELWRDSAYAFGKRYRVRTVFPEDPMMN
ncbi:MAG: YqgE/AlgH family protein [Odoribacteraceae bacterium]|jgi:putative transcriptional regulator|nr:YqgE/AlgH family protein [Odoribacteraceae bacterium]